MPAVLDTQNIIEETNQALLKGTRIDPNDPIVANVILNQVILSRYVASLNKTLETHQQQLFKALESEKEAARSVASKVITQSTDYLIENIQATGQVLQKQLLTVVEKAPQPRLGSLFMPWLYLVSGLAIGLVIGYVI